MTFSPSPFLVQSKPGFSPLLCTTPYITKHVCSRICHVLDIKPQIFDVSLFTTAMKERGKSIEWLTLIAYNLIKLNLDDEAHCQLVDLSNMLLNLGIGSLSDVEDFGMIQTEILDQFRVKYCFREEILQCYFAALYLANQPIMHVHNFASSLRLFKRSKWKVLEFYFGLVSAGIAPVAKDGLFYILSYISQSFNINRPFINDHLVLLILRCLHEANDDSLALQVSYELLKSQVFAYNVVELSDSLSAVAYYLTLQNELTWKVYCPQKSMADELMKEVKRIQNDKKTARQHQTSVIVVKEDDRMIFGDPQRIVITTRSVDYVITSLRQAADDGVYEDVISLENSAAVITGGVVQQLAPSSPSPSLASEVTLLPYGHLTEEQLRAKKYAEVVIYFNLMKDLTVPYLQFYSPLLIQSQYRKGDHNWYVFSRNMRHDFYEAVMVDPIVAMHWVKVRQPDGTKELEDKYKLISNQRYQTTSDSSTSLREEEQREGEREVAELVFLNSTRVIHFMITPPTGVNPVLIALYSDADECTELGFIGCSFQLDTCIELPCKSMKPFELGEDEKIVCLLPLPSNKGTEPGEMTANTAAANANSMEKPTLKIPPFVERTQAKAPSTQKQSFTPLTSFISSTRYMSEHLIKQHAMIGFEQPGYCFYGDSTVFEPGRIYTEPPKLPKTKVIREGGNGLVLEVTFEGTIYAVKRTAFRWREVLIMPKLHHSNILTLVALIMGPPIEFYPRRRYIYHFYPRMSGDLGRSVGSYERYCLRSLRERYKNEPLLLKKIHSNFKNLFTCLLEALNYLHTLPNPIIHRDVKPSNILLQMICDCPNILACVCRKTPEIVLSDFDASLELNPDATLQRDPSQTTRSASSSSSSDYYHLSTDTSYHISPVGTIGFKSPEGSMYIVSNSPDLVKHFTTKVDIFSFGLLACLLTMNEEGPKYINQVGTLLLSIHKTPSPQLTDRDRFLLQKNGVTQVRPREPYVTENDIHKILPIVRLRKSFSDVPDLVDFIEKMLFINPTDRSSAAQLLSHPYLNPQMKQPK